VRRSAPVNPPTSFREAALVSPMLVAISARSTVPWSIVPMAEKFPTWAASASSLRKTVVMPISRNRIASMGMTVNGDALEKNFMFLVSPYVHSMSLWIVNGLTSSARRSELLSLGLLSHADDLYSFILLLPDLSNLSIRSPGRLLFSC